MSFLTKIKEIPITDLSERMGYTLVRRGRYYSLREHDSVMIDTQKNCFWRNSRFVAGRSGGAGSCIDFVMEFRGVDRKKAMRELAVMYGIHGGESQTILLKNHGVNRNDSKRNQAKRKPGNVEFPARDNHTSVVYRYLYHERKIHREVINFFLGRRMLYQSREHQNCVFCTPDFACVRGTDPKRRYVADAMGCNYQECFFFKGHKDAKTLIAAESVIDLMSIMSLQVLGRKSYLDACYLALAGTNKLESVFYHVRKERFEKVLICYDNDMGGLLAAEKTERGLEELGVPCQRRLPPYGCDWNDCLKLYIRKNSDRARCGHPHDEESKEKPSPLCGESA